MTMATARTATKRISETQKPKAEIKGHETIKPIHPPPASIAPLGASADTPPVMPKNSKNKLEKTGFKLSLLIPHNTKAQDASSKGRTYVPCPNKNFAAFNSKDPAAPAFSKKAKTKIMLTAKKTILQMRR